MSDALSILNPNRDVKASYRIVRAGNSYGIYAQRLILRITEIAQKYLRGRDLNSLDDIQALLEFSDRGHAEFTIPVSSLMPEDDRSHYSQVRRELSQLQDVRMVFEDGDQWVRVPLLSRIEMNRRRGVAQIELQPEVWRLFMDFSNGFRRFELKVALSLRSVYALKMFQLMSNNTAKKIRFSVDELRVMFNLTGKYSKPADLIHFVIESAKDELDSCAPWSFDFEPVYGNPGGGRGRPGIVAVDLKPRRQDRFRDPDLEEKDVVSRTAVGRLSDIGLDHDSLDVLRHKFEFSDGEIVRNAVEFAKVSGFLGGDFSQYLRKMFVYVREHPDIENPKGYLVGSLRKKIAAMEKAFED